MIRPPSRFKFFRCLILCIGFVASPTSTMAQVMTLQADGLADLANPDKRVGPINGEEDIGRTAGSAAISTSPPPVWKDSSLPASKQLTFQFLTSQSADSGAANPTIAAATQGEDGIRIAQTNPDQQKASKNKKSTGKQFKKGKNFQNYCSLFFEGTVTRGSEFTASGNFSSATLIQVFDDEAAYLAGASAEQTIEYSTASTEGVSVGDQIGSLTVKTTQTKQLTFQYLSAEDTNYTDVVITRSASGYGAVTGVIDADNEAYIVVSDGRRGKKCKKFKQVRQCKKGGNIAVQGNMTAGGNFIEPIDCSSDTLVQIFDDAPDFIFKDVSKTYWASRFIYRLSSLQIVEGFPDGKFLPETGLTQAQFAAIVSRAFNVSRVRQVTVVASIPRDYWAHGDLQTAYSMGFIDITSSTFNVEQRLTKLDVLTSIATGLGYTQISAGRSVDDILSVFSDANTIPADDRVYIAALVEKGILVNYPNVGILNVNQVISRAETCALVHQALVSLGQIEGISSDYIVQ